MLHQWVHPTAGVDLDTTDHAHDSIIMVEGDQSGHKNAIALKSPCISYHHLIIYQPDSNAKILCSSPHAIFILLVSPFD